MLVTVSLFFYIDLLLPLGVAAGMPYAIMALISYWLHDFRYSIGIAILASILTVAGYYLSDSGTITWIVIVNRCLALLVIWITTILVILKLKADKKLQLAASVFTNAYEGIMITYAFELITEVNSSFIKMTGYSREELIGSDSGMLKSDKHSKVFYHQMWNSIATTGSWSGEVTNRRKNGETFVELKTISCLYDENGIVTNYLSMGTDITVNKLHQRQMERSAHYDQLTGLPNRELLSERLSHIIIQCKKHQQSSAIVVLDLDNFKLINDTYGHDVGDQVLIKMSKCIGGVLREWDTLSRIGGDEFVIILTHLDQVTDCYYALERLLKATSSSITVGNAVIPMSASIGVATYPEDNVDAELLIRHADQAMYVAKQAGKNCYRLFDTAQDKAVNIQQESLGNIRRALQQQEFVLYYQPKVNMSTGEIIGVEALIRWQHPLRGLLPPLDFLPAIEGHAISLEIGEWVIATALSQISQWHEMGFTFRISVNVSAYQIQQIDFVERLAVLLAVYPEVAPDCLGLEILETSALSDINQVAATMDNCMALGVRFALDDFGTGYSSLTYLRRLPVRLIKIDQSFVRNMLQDPEDLAIVKSVIALAKSFKRDVIAEGVETIEHGTALLQLGCELAQGYGIARPMPEADIPTWVNKWKLDDAWQS